MKSLGIVLAAGLILLPSAGSAQEKGSGSSDRFTISLGLSREGSLHHSMGSHLLLGYRFARFEAFRIRGEWIWSNTRTNEPAILATGSLQPDGLGPLRATASVGSELFGRRWFFERHSLILGMGVEVDLPFVDGLFAGLRHVSSDGGMTLLGIGMAF